MEWNIDNWYNIDEHWKHYAIWKKPDTKHFILNDSIYMNRQDQTHRKISDHRWLGGGENREWLSMNTGVILGKKLKYSGIR